MFSLKSPLGSNTTTPLLGSQLYNEETFYKAFLDDIRSAKSLVIIESPFITLRRLGWLMPALRSARDRDVRVVINTRDPDQHDDMMRPQALSGIALLQGLGVTVLYTVNHHRKLAIVDDTLWEGSLNILSQSDSCEIMRRTTSPQLVYQMIAFIGLGNWYNKQ